MTQSDLGEKVGLSKRSILTIEGGTRLLDVAEFLAIADALNVPPDLLYRDDPIGVRFESGEQPDR